MKLNTNQLTDAIRYGLSAALVGAVAMPVVAQAQDSGQDEKATKLEKVLVTGSRIKRADVEGASPVVVIEREEIDRSGKVSVSELLRDTTFNSFGSFRPTSGSSAQGLSTISLRGLGSNRTLILIDGRRLPKSPQTGSAPNLNVVPLGAVERIEILSDGASAIYGSDAIGGVVNIITRKDYEGAEFSFGLGNPVREGGETEGGHFLFGASSDRASLLGGHSYNYRGNIYSRERPFTNTLGLSTFGNNYRVANAAGTGIQSGSGFTPMPGFACNSNGFFLTNPGGAGNTCSFNFNSVSSDTAKIRVESTFVKGEFEINDNWSTYMSATVTRSSSYGIFAPVPGEVFVASGARGDPLPLDGRGAFVRHRFAAAGNREQVADEVLYDKYFGFVGNIFDRVELDFGVRKTESKFTSFGRNYIIRSLAELAIADGSYNLLNPYAATQATLNRFRTTINREGHYIHEEASAVASFDMFEMANGPVSMVVGAEYRTEDYADKYDALSEGGVVLGSAGNSAALGRTVTAGYFETLIPVLENFEITVAGRLDKYSDYGNDFAPKVSFRYQPLDNLTLRATYGEGFAAPTLDLLSQQPAFSADSVRDLRTCQSFGITNCATANPAIQINGLVVANPDLGSETSKQWLVGAAWDATDWLNMTLDYSEIEITDRIRSFSSQTLIDRANNPSLGPIPPGLSVTRDAAGAITQVVRGNANDGFLNANNVDFNARTNFDFGGAGRLRSNFLISYVTKFSIQGDPSIAGLGGVPKFRANLNNTWTYGDFDITWNMRHIDSHQNLVSATNLTPFRNGSTTLHDVQANWNAPWRGQVTLGVTNIEDEMPPLDGAAYDQGLYDTFGRVIYVKYTQRF